MLINVTKVQDPGQAVKLYLLLGLKQRDFQSSKNKVLLFFPPVPKSKEDAERLVQLSGFKRNHDAYLCIVLGPIHKIVKTYGFKWLSNTRFP